MNHCPVCMLAAGITEEPTEPAYHLPNGGPQSPAAARALANYDLVCVVGDGGMGVVYKAIQRNLRRIVAIKMVRSGSLATDAEISRFKSEVRAVAQLTHRNIIPIYEVGEEHGHHFFTMEFVEGSNLAEVIRGTPLAPDRAARYVQIIAEAIQYAHERAVLHRDLKSANVIIDEADQPRVTDFGLAKQLHPTGSLETEFSASSVTRSGTPLGTPSYMPPEQAQGRRQEIGPWSDIYSIGAILYDCLTGRPPFRADSSIETLRQVVETEPAAPRALNPKIPRDLETICLKCLSKEPASRYTSARELANDLGRYLSHEPIRARPVGWIGRGIRWSRRNPTMAGFCAAMAGLLLMVGWAALFQRANAMLHVKNGASQTARLVQDELKPIKAVVHEVASHKDLSRLVASLDAEALRVLLSSTQEKHKQTMPEWLRLQNWVIMTPEGTLVLRWPGAGKRNIEHRHVRDYFKGATNLAALGVTLSPFVSNAYLSEEDDRNKFGVSEAIRDRDGKVAGVLALMVSPTELASVALGPWSGSEFALASEWDNSSPLAGIPAANPSHRREFRIVFHPAFGTNNFATPIDHPVLDRMPNTSRVPLGDFFYRDPVAGKYARYRGWWLAGFAHVPETKLVVIYQTRDWVIDAIAIALAVTAMSGLPLLLWSFWKRRGRRRLLLR